MWLLLEKGANIHAINNYGCRTPLCLAISNGHVETGLFLLKEGADINAINEEHQIMLRIAALEAGTVMCCHLSVRGLHTIRCDISACERGNLYRNRDRFRQDFMEFFV